MAGRPAAHGPGRRGCSRRPARASSSHPSSRGSYGALPRGRGAAEEHKRQSASATCPGAAQESGQPPGADSQAGSPRRGAALKPLRRGFATLHHQLHLRRGEKPGWSPRPPHGVTLGRALGPPRPRCAAEAAASPPAPHTRPSDGEGAGSLPAETKGGQRSRPGAAPAPLTCAGSAGRRCECPSPPAAPAPPPPPATRPSSSAAGSTAPGGQSASGSAARGEPRVTRGGRGLLPASAPPAGGRAPSL